MLLPLLLLLPTTIIDTFFPPLFLSFSLDFCGLNARHFTCRFFPIVSGGALKVGLVLARLFHHLKRIFQVWPMSVLDGASFQQLGHWPSIPDGRDSLGHFFSGFFGIWIWIDWALGVASRHPMHINWIIHSALIEDD